MKPFNIGVIGIGDISNVYLNNLKKYDIVNLLACASRGIEKARKKAEEYDIQRPYASGQELIDDPDVDIVLNLTSPAAHSLYNVAALKAGKHVYTEKPLGSDLESAREMISLAAEKGLYIGCAPDTFLGGRLQTCRKIIDEGVIGEMTGASAFCMYHGVETFHPNPTAFYKPGAGPLLDIGPYYVTALLSILGPVKRCSAMAKMTYPSRTSLVGPNKGQVIAVEVDTHVIGNLEFANGALAMIGTSFDVWDSQLPRLEFYGTQGTLCIPDIDPLDGPNLFGGPLLVKTEKEYRWYSIPRPQELPDWTEATVKHQFNSITHAENSRGIGLIDMAYAIKNARKQRASGDMALHALEVMTRMLDSAKDGKFFDIESTFTRPELLPVDFPRSEP